MKRVAELTAAAEAARAELGALEGQRETLTTDFSALQGRRRDARPHPR